MVFPNFDRMNWFDGGYDYDKIDTKFKTPTRDELAKYNPKYTLTDFIPTKK